MKLAERMPGILLACLGLVLYFHLIPGQTEVIEYGWTKPQTIPNVAAWIIAVGGAAIAAVPPPFPKVHVIQFGRGLFFLAIMAAGLALIANLGFIFSAPVLALTIMLLVGERRLSWLVGGSVIMPFVIWLMVEILLGRNLP